jgi:hypothetical protein
MNDPIRRLGALIVVAAASSLVAPSAVQAATHRFKVDLTIVQTTDWTQQVRHPAPGDGYCGTRDVHYVYSSSGDGELRAKIRGARVRFTGTRTQLRSSEIKVPGKALADHSGFTIERQGVPDEHCDVPPPPSFPPDQGCNPLVRWPGVARSFLLVLRGRLTLTGGFYRRDMTKTCADPSAYTGVVGFGGRPARRDVNRLITNKRVRSIELGASDTTAFTPKHLMSFGANSETIAGSGTGKARWRVKLTRLR